MHVGRGADCLIRCGRNRSSRDSDDGASLDAYRKQDVVSRHTLEVGFRIVDNQESLLVGFVGVLLEIKCVIYRFHFLESLGNTINLIIVVNCISLTSGLWQDADSKLPNSAYVSPDGVFHGVPSCNGSSNGSGEGLGVRIIGALKCVFTIVCFEEDKKVGLGSCIVSSACWIFRVDRSGPRHDVNCAPHVIRQVIKEFLRKPSLGIVVEHVINT